MAESARRRRLRATSFGVGEVIGDTFSIWFRNLIPFYVLTVIVHAPLIIYAAAILYGDLSWLDAEMKSQEMLEIRKELAKE